MVTDLIVDREVIKTTPIIRLNAGDVFRFPGSAPDESYVVTLDRYGSVSYISLKTGNSNMTVETTPVVPAVRVVVHY